MKVFKSNFELVINFLNLLSIYKKYPMKNILPVALFSLLFFTSSITFAQMGIEETGASRYMTNKRISIHANQGSSTGSVYENKDFVNGYVFENGKILASNVALRYNAQRDEIEVKSSLKTSSSSAKVLVKNDDIYIKIMNKIFVYAPLAEGIDKAGYFIVLQEGDNYSLYKKISKEFVEGKEAFNSMTRDTPSAFKTKEKYYLVNKSNGSFTVFPKSKKGKLRLFTQNKKKIKDFINTNRLNVNKDYALAKLVKYYDTL